MFSGWGVRTLAANEARHTPMSYHNGSVWPHDNAIIAEGLARAGYRWEAAALLETFFDAASFMDIQRLPELFAASLGTRGRSPCAIRLRLVRHPEDVGVTASNMTAPIDVIVVK